MVAARLVQNAPNYAQNYISPVTECLLPCIPVAHANKLPCGSILLQGLVATEFEWNLEDYITRSPVLGKDDRMTAMQMLAVEYDDDGVNVKFRTIVQGTTCIIGNADSVTQRMYQALGFDSIPLGGSVGNIDCHIGGVPGTCSERAACIRFVPSEKSMFQVACLAPDDFVTLNGSRILPEMGYLPLLSLDVISVGARVFACIMANP
jgi:hypothetical protein